jgi:two-component system chemotaxis response regulator CheV
MQASRNLTDKNPNSRLINQFEAGGNFFELIEFSLIRHLEGQPPVTGLYGVNVAKVREVVHMPKINPLGSAVKGVAGLFELRGVPIPAVNLCQILGDHQSEITPKQQIIVTEFSQKRAGFIVQSTHRIRRVSWDKVLPPSSDSSSCITGMILLDNHEFLFILDLEKILSNIEDQAFPESRQRWHQPAMGYDWGNYHPPVSEKSNGPVILVVDDSRLILHNVSRALLHEGFQVITAPDGRRALERVEQILGGKDHSLTRLDAVVTDIEMPQMDGITLTARLREKAELAHMPILLHTSLDGEASKEAAERVGANGYVLKNDVFQLIECLKQQIHRESFQIAT